MIIGKTFLRCSINSSSEKRKGLIRSEKGAASIESRMGIGVKLWDPMELKIDPDLASSEESSQVIGLPSKCLSRHLCYYP